MRSSTSLLTTAMMLAVAHASATVQLSLKSDAMVTGSRVVLSDVATFDDGRTNVAALSAVDLGTAPLPGYTHRMTRREIERLVRSHGLPTAISWRGADAVRVERAARPFDAAPVVASATAYLHQLLEREFDRVAIQISAPLPDLLLPVGKLEFKPRPMPPAQAAHRQVTVWVDVLLDGVFLRAMPVLFNVQAYKAVLVTRRDLPKGTVPQCEALQLRDEDVAALDGTPYPADCQAVQGHLKRALMQGDTLLKGHLQTPSAVAQGDSVSLQVSDGAVMLESRAIALANGEVGQRIDVRPSGSVETILVEVIAPGVVTPSGK